jgi:hypothetical protein
MKQVSAKSLKFTKGHIHRSGCCVQLMLVEVSRETMHHRAGDKASLATLLQSYEIEGSSPRNFPELHIPIIKLVHKEPLVRLLLYSLYSIPSCSIVF